MEIAGLQKLTLLDYPGHIACTVFLAGCNLRCPFCHNASLVLPGREGQGHISQEELLDFLRRRAGKLSGVCITGGEPTLRKELPALIAQIRQLGLSVKLDTNGSNPQMLQSLLADGLVDYVAMDIKNSPARYAETCGGVDVLEAVKKSVSLLVDGPWNYEFRTTVSKPYHTQQDMAQIGQWIQGAKAYYLQQFVDSGDLIGTGIAAHTPEELEALRQAVLPYVPNTSLRGI